MPPPVESADYRSDVGSTGLVAEQIATLRERARVRFPGTDYVVFWSPEQQKVLAAPIEFVVTSPFSHAIDYGSGGFEGLNALVNAQTGVPQVILLDARSDRFYQRTLQASQYKSPVTQAEFKQAVLDFVAINGFGLFRDPNGPNMSDYVRAYIRPTVHPAGIGGYGVHMTDDQPIDFAVVTWRWPDYLKPELYTNGGIVAVTGQQRLAPVRGKHAFIYGAASQEGNVARILGADELLYLAPYYVDQYGHEFWGSPYEFETKMKYGVIADGPGEECVAITADGKTLVYPPMRVNRLGGTVLQYIIDHMAQNVGLATEERNITLRDIRAGKYLALVMLGNAVKVAPIRLIKYFRDGICIDGTELFSEKSIPEPVQKLIQRYDEETRGIIAPSHSSLVTSVDLARGTMLRVGVDQMFKSH
ncbi:hypothetical protein HY086_04530 [Candidatus Gottesmanbacteria bacterium]|nr:hypothetical protein [Candidatus Gottesmanbacteria bacterium]